MFLIAICSLLALVGACSSEGPTIEDVSWRVRIVVNGERLLADETAEEVFETAKHMFGVFVAVQDRGSAETIQSLTLENPQAEISWVLDKDLLQIKGMSSGQIWVGYDQLVMPTGDPIPSGVWNVQVMDARGNSDEVTITLTEYTLPHETSHPDITTQDFPRVSPSGDGIDISWVKGDATGQQDIRIVGVIDDSSNDASIRQDRRTGTSIDLQRSVTSGIYGEGTETLVWMRSAGTHMLWYVSRIDSRTGIELISGPYVLPIK